MNDALTNQLEELRAYFREGKTRKVHDRRYALEQLEKSLRRHEKDITAALRQDLGKSPYESFMAELGFVLGEVKYQKRKLGRWMRPKWVLPSFSQMPGKTVIQPQPYGVVLIMSPWNYPFLITMIPLAGAIAAGNTVMIKPSAYAPASMEVIQKIVSELPKGLVHCVSGGREENRQLLEMKFDYIFFTGSPHVGREVMKAAARDLTPFTLELGGKSPCIVDETANIPKTASRILFGKLMNAGQTCVAPDYILAHSSVKDELVKELIEQHEKMLPEDFARNHWGRIINQKHFERLEGYLSHQRLLLEEPRNSETRFFGFTIIDEPSWDSPVMQEEIFGPILPVISYENFGEMTRKIQSMDSPLALYFFSKDKKRKQFVQEELLFGGGCINDTLLHLTNVHLPFGGVGNSGIGRYHGKTSFDTFSHRKSMLRKSWWMDVPIRYYPYKNPEGRPPEVLF